MAKLKLLNTIFSKLSSLSKNDGQIVVTRDSKSLYIDLEGERIEITDWIDVDNEESLLAILSPLTNKYYYTKDTNKIWKYVGSEWICLNNNINEMMPTYTESTTLTKLKSGEKISVAFGKISKAVTDLISHIGDSIKHITNTERTNWDLAKTHADSTHARTDATKVEKSTTNGNIKINGSETVVYTHPSGTNPHGTTKSDVGLGNVGNFKAVSTVANQGLTDTEKSNARANIGAGTSSFSGSYNDLSNKPTIPTVGNGTVTIKQAGTSKGTFTMNQSGDTTIELTDNNTTYGVATQSANGLESAADKKKLDGIATGAEVNQNAFSNVVVGSTTISADSKTDSLTLAGSNVTITPDADNDKVTIGITKANVTSALGYTPPTTNTTYGVATSSALGLVKSGTDITVDSNGNVSVNDDSHNHVISNIDGLQTALDGKAASSHTHNYLPLSGGTVTGQIKKDGISSGWVNGRNTAIVRMSSIDGYSPFASIKTTNGSWEIGAYKAGTWDDSLLFTYITDSDYNASNNRKEAQIRFYHNGVIEGRAKLIGSYTSNVSSRYGYGGLEIRENNSVGNAQSDIGYAPSIGFHWSQRCAGTLCLDKDAIFHFLKQDGTRATLDANINGNINGYTWSPETEIPHVSGNTSFKILALDGTRVKHHRIPEYIIGSYSDSTFYKVTNVLTFKDTNNALITGDKGNFIWAVSSWSDRKLKKNIKDADISALDKINQIRFKEFDFIDDNKFGKHQELGYIADELKEVFPECVVTVPQDKEKFGYEELDQVQDVGMIKYLAKAIQELTGIIKEQNEKIDTLQKEVDKLKRKN